MLPVWIWGYNSTNNQHWYIVNDGDGYKFIAKHSGFALDVTNAATANGTYLQQYRPNGTLAQRFFLEEAPKWHNIPEGSDPEIKNGTYIIHTDLDRNKVVTVAGDNMDNGRNVYIWDNHKNNDQIWELKRQEDGSFTIKSQYNDQFMDVVDQSIGNEINILTWENYNGDNQKWYIVDNGDGTHRLVAKHSGYVMDVMGAQTHNGANIQQYTWTGNHAQRFILERFPAPTLYRVIFTGWNGRLLGIQTVEQGESAVFPTPPVEQGYTFSHWSTNPVNVTSDMEVSAIYTKNAEPPTQGENTQSENHSVGEDNSNQNNSNQNHSNQNQGETQGNHQNSTSNVSQNEKGITQNSGSSKGSTGSGGGGGSRGGGGGGSRGGGGGGSRSVSGSSLSSTINSAKAADGTWLKVNHRWMYKKSDGNAIKTSWKQLTGAWYFFNEEGYMQTGWINLNNVWYYLNSANDSSEGKMATGWNWIAGKSYYFDPVSGRLHTNTITPDGYTVNANGEWVVNNIVQTR